MIRERAVQWLAGVRRIIRLVSVADRVALGILVVLPTALNLPLSLAGHPIIPGDDLAQNYPLRVLAGSFIRAGHLPTWDPFIWSGTPLLAGWNAGALYPATWLFALLPGVAAWTVNIIAVGAVCGTGTYLLLRRFGCGPLAALIGALCFTDTGFMSGQIVHLGLVEGTGFLPWTILAVEIIATAKTLRARGAAVVLLGLGACLCVLAGEPRAITSEAIVLVIYIVARSITVGSGQRMRLLLGSAAGVVLGMGLSAIQWMPGLSFVSGSQRGLGAFSSFGAGSLNWQVLGHFLLLPFLVGGNGNFGLPLYHGGYNLPEESIGAGLLAISAALVYLPRVLARPIAVVRTKIVRILGPPGAPAALRWDLGVWFVIGIVGVLLTLGTTTPIGGLLAHVPLYGGERLQNRNAVIFDFALAVLLAFFMDDIFSRNRSRRAGELRVIGPIASPIVRLLAAGPPVIVVLVVAVAYLHPKGLQAHLGVARPSAHFFDRLTPYLAVTVVLAVAIGLFVVLAHHLSARVQTLAVALIAFADIGVYVANASYATAPSAELAGPTTSSAALLALTGQGGRFAIYNPLVNILPSNPGFSASLGETDLNILRGISSVQGYGSIVGGTYQDATSTHDYEDLDPAVLKNGLANVLDLRVLLTLPSYLEEQIPPDGAIPVAGRPPVTANGLPAAAGSAPAPPLLASGPWTIEAGGGEQWLLPSALALRRVIVVVDTSGGPTSLDVSLTPGRGTPPFATVPVVNGEAELTLPSSRQQVESVVVRDPSFAPVTIGAVVVDAPKGRFVLDGSLQGSLTSAQWSYAGVIGPYTAFVNKGTAGRAWLQPTTSLAPDVERRAPGTIATTVNPSNGTEADRVQVTRPTLLVRSVAYQTGWTANVVSDGGHSETAPVDRFGLVQAVRIPAGRYLVTFRYAATGLDGRAVTIGSALAAVILGMIVARGRRPKRSNRTRRHARGALRAAEAGAPAP